VTKGSKRRQARAESARLIETAERLLKAGKNAEAVKTVVTASRLAPNDPEILAHLGWTYLRVGGLHPAVTALRRSIALRPNVAEVHVHLGRALEALADYEAAIIAYREAVALDPELAGAHGRLADLLHQKGRRSEAAVSYERAGALMPPGSSTARLQRAKALFATDRFDEAERELRGVLLADPSNTEALHMLGRMVLTAGNLAEASAMFERLVELDPAAGSAYQGLVSSRRFTEADRPWISRILSQLESVDWHKRLAPVDAERQLMAFHFALGKILDDLGDYAGAMKHFDAANAARRKLGPFNSEAIERRVERLSARYTQEFFAKHSALGDPDPTPILIVGLPRSGTSLLERVLSSHPRVRGCGELDFWNDRGPKWAEAEPTLLANVAESFRADYLRLLRGGNPDVLRATDKMPFNFFWVGLAHLLFPKAVIVHCRRNPIDTCLSIYTTSFMAIWDFASRLEDLVAYYRLYQRLVDHWRTVIPSDLWIDVDYEDVVGDPERIARSLVSFCGLEWDAACLHPELNRQAVATASAWQARQPIYRSSVERWRRYEPWIVELKQLAGAG
jgi:tetratricopeptide (TPR) repeat protein